MVCKNCGKELPENTKFCGHCGESAASPSPAAEAVCAACGAGMKGRFCNRCGAEVGGGVQTLPKPEMPPEAHKAPPQPKARTETRGKTPSPPAGPGKRRGKRLLIILAAVLLLGVATGLWGAHYVAKNGWRSVPFAEKLTFLSFVRLDKEKTETYSDPAEEPEDAEKEKKDDDVEAEAPSAPAGEAPAVSTEVLEGDWAFESREGYVLVRFNADGTYIIGANLQPAIEWIRSIGNASGQYAASGVAEFTMSCDGAELARASVVGETVKLILNGETYVLMRYSGPAYTGITGVWNIILGEADDAYLNFLPSGDAYLGKRMPSGEIRWGIAGDDDWDGKYSYDADHDLLRMEFIDDMEWKFRRTGNYAWLEIDGEVWTMKYMGESGAFPQPDYILSDSNQRVYTSEDLRYLDSSELKLARNEIYARHGRLFTDPDLQAYFDSQPWYRGTVQPDDFDDAVLSEIEKQNAVMIREVEQSRTPSAGVTP